MYSFSYLEPVCCSMSSSNCCFLTCTQGSQEAGQAVWYSHLFHHFPQFIVIHTVKGFGIVNKAEIDVFLELSCFFDDPAGVGNLISGSSAFSKTSLNIWSSWFTYCLSLAWRILSITLLACLLLTSSYYHLFSRYIILAFQELYISKIIQYIPLGLSSSSVTWNHTLPHSYHRPSLTEEKSQTYPNLARKITGLHSSYVELLDVLQENVPASEEQELWYRDISNREVSEKEIHEYIKKSHVPWSSQEFKDSLIPITQSRKKI